MMALDKICDFCDGSGECYYCKGTGNVKKIVPHPDPKYVDGYDHVNCQVCKGSGVCPYCNGSGRAK